MCRRIPFLDEPAFQWYASFDPLGDILPRPDPTPALALLATVMQHLMADCRWRADRLHLFGFAQGGSVAAEVALRAWQRGVAVGSVVSVCGPLLEYPTPPALCPTHVLFFARAADAGAVAAFRKGFAGVMEVVKKGEQGMPRSREEWEPIMRFWSEHLSKRTGDGLYEVMTGSA